MTVLLIEDEQPAARRLTNLLHEIDPSLQVLPALESVSDVVAYLQIQPHPDLILSDIQLSDGLSFDAFRQVEPRCPIIFTTAYDEYAIQAFKLNSLDYLLKPVVADELRTALAKFNRQTALTAAPPADYASLWQSLSQSQRAYRQRFLIAYRDTYRAVRAEEVAYFYSENKITRLVCPDGKWYPIPETLEEIAEQVDPRQFFRANRQCIIRIDSIETIHKHFNGRLKIDLNPPASEDVFVSRERADEFKQWLNG